MFAKNARVGQVVRCTGNLNRHAKEHLVINNLYLITKIGEHPTNCGGFLQVTNLKTGKPVLNPKVNGDYWCADKFSPL